MCFVVTFKKSLPNPNSQRIAVMYLSKRVIVLDLKFMSTFYLELISMHSIRGLTSSFTCSYSVAPAPCVEKICSPLSYFGNFVKNQLIMIVRVPFFL